MATLFVYISSNNGELQVADSGFISNIDQRDDHEKT